MNDTTLSNDGAMSKSRLKRLNIQRGIKQDDITLSNGVTITHKPLDNGGIEASVKGSDREITQDEWTEYVRRWMGH